MTLMTADGSGSLISPAPLSLNDWLKLAEKYFERPITARWTLKEVLTSTSSVEMILKSVHCSFSYKLRFGQYLIPYR